MGAVGDGFSVKKWNALYQYSHFEGVLSTVTSSTG